MTSRRGFLSLIGLGSLAGAVLPHSARAQHEGHGRAAPLRTDAGAAPAPVPAHVVHGYRPVHTLNGWTLPWTMKNGAKEFHLVAEEVEHEFAPGCKAKCWGYNGSTPGPTIEAVEGDRVRILVTNRLREPTTIHWHGLYLPSGMDGVGGLSQPPIRPGETYVYEFTLQQNGTYMYHPHADEMVQLAVGMMGLFIIHPKAGEPRRIDRDYALLLHNWALHPGTYRPDPSIMTEFDLWTFNSKVFPAIESMLARTGDRVRIRIGNLSMHEHPMHLHGVQFEVTGGDGGRWPVAQWRREVTALVGVGQTRDLEFTAVAGDWAFHCHKSHHTMNAMGHGIPSPLGVDTSGVEDALKSIVPGYMAMGRDGMSEHAGHVEMGMLEGPRNTLPMMGGTGPFGPLEMGGMFTVLKVRDDLGPKEMRDPGPYRHPKGTLAQRVSDDPEFGAPVRRSSKG